MSLFSKIGNAFGKAAKFVVSSPIGQMALGSIPVVGGIASKAAQFAGKMQAKGSSVGESTPTLVPPSGVAASGATRSMNSGGSGGSGGGISDFFSKAKDFVKKYWLYILAPIGLVIIFIIVKMVMKKKPAARRRSTSFLAKARAAKAAKARKR